MLESSASLYALEQMNYLDAGHRGIRGNSMLW